MFERQILLVCKAHNINLLRCIAQTDVREDARRLQTLHMCESTRCTRLTCEHHFVQVQGAAVTRSYSQL
jgi:hypothetical protein